jgi:pSer/pThr/pTyr-binding forkhead associated (FHA) protein
MKARLVGRRRDGTLKSFALGDLARIGSASVSEVVVERDRVSPLHALITLEDAAYWVEDKRSDYGTFVNGSRVGKTKLRHFDVLTIAPDVNLVFLTTQSGGGRVKSSAGTVPPRFKTVRIELDMAAEAPIETVCLIGDAGTFKITLGTAVVGRGTEAAIHISSQEVSRRHAKFVVRPTEVTLEDLKSANGTRLNGTVVTVPAKVGDGDTVSFAGFKFRVEVARLEGEG